MALTVTTAEKTEKKGLKMLNCPICGERVRGIRLTRDSKVSGLIFRCKKCKNYFSVKTE